MRPSSAPALPATRLPRSGQSSRAWQSRSSPLARYALLAYLLIVIDSSLYPFTGWRDLGIGPFDYLGADWPGRVLAFDFAVNAIGYVPLGFVAGLALHPWLRSVAMIVVASAICAAVSVGCEAIQTYLPSRVASNVDVISNVAGGVVGAFLAARFAKPLLETGQLRVWRTRCFAADASRGLVLVVTWFGVLVYPGNFAFGMGDVLKTFDPDLARRLAISFGLASASDAGLALSQYQAAESLVCALALLASGLLFVNLLRARAPLAVRLTLLAGFIVTTVLVKSLAFAFLSAESGLLPIAVPAARLGLLAGALALMATALLPMRMRWALGVAALLAVVALVNVCPDNPYANPVALAWTRGRLMNFFGLARGLNIAWPFFALAYFLRHREPGPRRASL